MKGKWTKTGTVTAEDGTEYRAFKPSWKDGNRPKFSSIRDQHVEFTVESGKIVVGSLKLVDPPAAAAPVAVAGPAQPSMRQIRLASVVAATVEQVNLTLTQECTLGQMEVPDDSRTNTRPTQADRHEDFASVAAFKTYTELNFAENVDEEVCPCCLGDFHSDSTPQTFWQYYRLDGNRERRRDLQAILGQKLDKCSCNGWVFPHPPNNVYRRATTDEHATTVKKFDGAKKARGESNSRARDSLIKMSGVSPYEGANEVQQKKNKLNHLVPKSGGGCPVGRINLQAHDALCKECKAMDDLMTTWQATDKGYFSQLRGRYSQKCTTEGCNTHSAFNVTKCPNCVGALLGVDIPTCPGCKELLPKTLHENTCPNCRTDLG